MDNNDCEMKAETESKSLGKQLFYTGGVLFWPIVLYQLFTWLSEPVITYKPLKDANVVVFKRTQPFHKTVQFLITYRKTEDGYSDWVYKRTNGQWDVFFYDDGEESGIQWDKDYMPYK
jgi:hypothetical protein